MTSVSYQSSLSKEIIKWYPLYPDSYGFFYLIACSDVEVYHDLVEGIFKTYYSSVCLKRSACVDIWLKHFIELSYNDNCSNVSFHSVLNYLIAYLILNVNTLVYYH